jgi:uracil-DNA glycosylase
MTEKINKDVRIHDSWRPHLTCEFSQNYFTQLRQYILQEYAEKTIYPPEHLIFRAFDACPFDQVKVVLLGQDPYHGPGQANGLCFSVNSGVRPPPSLNNIFKEIESDLLHPISRDVDLSRWAKQGVLLLNATLTVRAAQAASHQNKGWETFTDATIKILAEKKPNIVFLLWGAYARRKGKTIDRTKHLVLESAHPSPLSAHNGFFGSKQFSQTNSYLKTHGLKPIEW